MAQALAMNASDNILQTGSIILAQPLWLWLIPSLLLLMFILRAYVNEGEASSLARGAMSPDKTFFHPLLARLPATMLGGRKKKSGHSFNFVIALLLILSLAEPVRLGERLPEAPPERDVVFIIDTSISMSLRDYLLDNERVDRMTMLKAVLSRFLRRLEGERIGLIVFGNSAYTFVPLTRDQEFLQGMLQKIETTMVGRFNAMGDGIALAVKQASAAKTETQRRHRVLIMLTDGDRSTGPIKPLAAAKIAKDEGIPLYIVAIGATAADAEEERAAGLIYEPVDLAALQAMTDISGGKTYQAGDTRTFEQAIQAIAQHEKNPRKLLPQYYHEPLYLWPLLLAMGLLLFRALGLQRFTQGMGKPREQQG